MSDILIYALSLLNSVIIKESVFIFSIQITALDFSKNIREIRFEVYKDGINKLLQFYTEEDTLTSVGKKIKDLKDFINETKE